MSQVMIAIADGSEDIETTTIIDVLRRADILVTVASVMPEQRIQVTFARGLQVIADTHISTIKDNLFDMIILPGGMPGAEHLRDSELLRDMLYRQREEQGFIAAICAAPAVVLASHGILNGIIATCYPSFHSQMNGAKVQTNSVVVDQKIITSKGVGTALPFSLEIVRLLAGETKAKIVAEAMLVDF